jgi:hypothetical protein
MRGTWEKPEKKLGLADEDVPYGGSGHSVNRPIPDTPIASGSTHRQSYIMRSDGHESDYSIPAGEGTVVYRPTIISQKFGAVRECITKPLVDSPIVPMTEAEGDVGVNVSPCE